MSLPSSLHKKDATPLASGIRLHNPCLVGLLSRTQTREQIWQLLWQLKSVGCKVVASGQKMRHAGKVAGHAALAAEVEHAAKVIDLLQG
jgi:hypothetical protein